MWHTAVQGWPCGHPIPSHPVPCMTALERMHTDSSGQHLCIQLDTPCVRAFMCACSWNISSSLHGRSAVYLSTNTHHHTHHRDAHFQMSSPQWGAGGDAALDGPPQVLALLPGTLTKQHLASKHAYIHLVRACCENRRGFLYCKKITRWVT